MRRRTGGSVLVAAGALLVLGAVSVQVASTFEIAGDAGDQIGVDCEHHG